MSYIRYFKKDDAGILADHLRTDPMGKMFLNYNGASEVSYLNNMKNDNWAMAIVMVEGDVPVGFAACEFDSLRQLIHIRSIYVIKSQRRKGFGIEMHDELEKMAKAAWPFATQIESYTIKGSNAAKYKVKKGYEQTGTYEDFYGKGLHQTRWVKKLDAR